ncbi:hypothetical protein [Mucilaginibacter sp. SG564]|uniref:hypothetical protein n=1 Tax=unclassified Mucilaginibacter TaxID=2617802 RepID=UPI001553683F|nr:hypothetical protein [Mucilaginibacter sp. SG564]NOW97429.1 hypothetical protein [Mucilaginibacter sp. SG564]
MKSLAVIILLQLVIAFNINAQPKLKLYGGKNHDQFLGYLSYIENDELNSIWSQFSDYGATHSAKSIWNENGIYGSKTSDYSSFNINAKYPPQVLDRNGKFYGYLTINKNNPKRSHSGMADEICNNRDRILEEGVEEYTEMFHTIHCGAVYEVNPIVFKPVIK